MSKGAFFTYPWMVPAINKAWGSSFWGPCECHMIGHAHPIFLALGGTYSEG